MPSKSLVCPFSLSVFLLCSSWIFQKFTQLRHVALKTRRPLSFVQSKCLQAENLQEQRHGISVDRNRRDGLHRGVRICNLFRTFTVQAQQRDKFLHNLNKEFSLSSELSANLLHECIKASDTAAHLWVVRSSRNDRVRLSPGGMFVVTQSDAFITMLNLHE
ncbi:hypothetical protein P154DRAFT_108856 [Amniculicola lignicola CBS 123094]|uniref:Uncharacterized protein n=1 Tax=Amniculicola lignicola CBS 123094 TaxID=1392246 RepID=A0A6A5WMS5_9PLEO|nr:hypothetical protein P154DRAFT_108856 [Amniculicola lignicola CBS 123094]